MFVEGRRPRFLRVPVSGHDEEIASAQDYAVCRRIMRAASKNYSFASAFLPADKLPHVEALYALMRVGDDRVDVSHQGFESPLAAVDDWERAYWRAFETGDSPDPVMRAYLNTATRFGIPDEVMSPYFRAMREDLTITRFPTFADLMHYMDGSALPVGRAMMYILGVRKPYTIAKALPGADALAVAMQLSNFWRDIGEDWAKIGRVYIPQEDLERFGYTEADIAAQHVNANLIELLEFELARTEHCYEQARSSIEMLSGGRWGVLSGLEIYHAILPGIRRNRYDVFTRRAGAGDMGKLGLVAKAWWKTALAR
jgi:phytoene synthase